MIGGERMRGLVLLCSLAVLFGCGDDDPTVPATTPGVLIIDPQPAFLAAPWTLTGPAGYYAEGAGYMQMEDRQPGNYTLTWGTLAAWERPSPGNVTRSLAAGGTLTVTGEYAFMPEQIESPDALMQIFRAAYAGRSLDVYQILLRPDFVFVTKARTATYGYDEEINLTSKIFAGQAGTDGITISRITIDRLDPQGVWQSADPNDENFGDQPNSLYRDYLVDFSFYVAGQNLRFRVEGSVRFFVVAQNCGEATCYKFLGMEDYTFGWGLGRAKTTAVHTSAATESLTWSGVKSLFN